MSAKSTYLANAVVNASLRNVSLAVAAWFVSLHTGDPGLVGSSEVPSTNAYIRIAGVFGAPSGGISLNTNIVTFAAPTPGNWGTITWAGVWDASTVGNFLYKIPLNFSVVTSIGVPVEFIAGALSIQET